MGCKGDVKYGIGTAAVVTLHLERLLKIEHGSLSIDETMLATRWVHPIQTGRQNETAVATVMIKCDRVSA